MRLSVRVHKYVYVLLLYVSSRNVLCLFISRSLLILTEEVYLKAGIVNTSAVLRK